jgi:uncharacterized protein
MPMVLALVPFRIDDAGTPVLTFAFAPTREVRR